MLNSKKKKTTIKKKTKTEKSLQPPLNSCGI